MGQMKKWENGSNFLRFFAYVVNGHQTQKPKNFKNGTEWRKNKLRLDSTCTKTQLMYIVYIFKETFFKKTVIFRILRIFNRLLQTKSVKKYILTE